MSFTAVRNILCIFLNREIMIIILIKILTSVYLPIIITTEYNDFCRLIGNNSYRSTRILID